MGGGSLTGGSAGVGAQVNCSDGSVSACALAPVASVVDVEEGLGLPEVGPPLIHMGC